MSREKTRKQGADTRIGSPEYLKKILPCCTMRMKRLHHGCHTMARRSKCDHHTGAGRQWTLKSLEKGVATCNQGQLGLFSFSSSFILLNFDPTSNLLYMKGVTKWHREILTHQGIKYERSSLVVVAWVVGQRVLPHTTKAG